MMRDGAEHAIPLPIGVFYDFRTLIRRIFDIGLGPDVDTETNDGCPVSPGSERTLSLFFSLG